MAIGDVELKRTLTYSNSKNEIRHRKFSGQICKMLWLWQEKSRHLLIVLIRGACFNWYFHIKYKDTHSLLPT